MALIHLDGEVEEGPETLGGKAWSIARMLKLGIDVPPAFVLTTDECPRYVAAGALPDDVVAALGEAIGTLESVTARTFGRGPAPLLVSVRSGAATSMPGMMDTLLNLGMTDAVEAALAEQTGDADYAADTTRRFRALYADVVGAEAPAEPWEQLHGAMCAVFESWQSDRARAYRERNQLADAPGTAVTVQAMVFGNLDDSSGTGVLFSRDPLSGSESPYGEWLPRGQGEDVVSGRHDPLDLDALAKQLPEIHRELLNAASRLEGDARDVQDIEFTVEAGKLWLLQARAAKRSPEAAIRLAVLLQREGLISEAEALARVTPEQVATLLRPHVDPQARAEAEVLATGRPASPGLVTGTVVTDVDEAERRAEEGEHVILARPTTDPNDVHAMSVVAGILTELGGSTSHAAVVSRELGVACVVGCGEGRLMALEGREVTVDARAGEVLAGRVPVADAAETDDPDLAQLSEWARAEQPNAGDRPLPELLEARRELR